jgi:hypothetical protein
VYFRPYVKGDPSGRIARGVGAESCVPTFDLGGDRQASKDSVDPLLIDLDFDGFYAHAASITPIYGTRLPIHPTLLSSP